MMLPVMVKGRGKIDEVFNDPERVESISELADTHFPYDITKGDWQLMQMGLFRLEELQDKHPVTASLQFPHLLLTL